MVENAPALKNEPYVSILNDYKPKIEFALQSTKFPGQAIELYGNDWSKITNMLLSSTSYGGQLDKTKIVNDLMPTILDGSENDAGKLTKIYQYVQNNIRYTVETQLYPQSRLKNVLEAKEGNSSEVKPPTNNMLIINL